MFRRLTFSLGTGVLLLAASLKALPLRFTRDTSVAVHELTTQLDLYSVKLSDALSAVRVQWNNSTNSFEVTHVANIPSVATGWVGKWAVDWDRLCDGKYEGTNIPLTLSQKPLKCEWGTPIEQCTNLKHTELGLEFQVRNYVLKGRVTNTGLSGSIYLAGNIDFQDGCWRARRVQRVADEQWVAVK